LPPLRVALATTHLPLKDVPAALTQDGLARILDIIDPTCARFGIAAPRILLCGLNPHAGEGGYLGREDIDVIAPAIAAAQARGIDARGPYPADTLFQPKYLKDADCVLAMYHDQGLPVLKYATFGQGVNITLGLPLIRTSVDHGTALDLAAQGLGLADCGSMDGSHRHRRPRMANSSLTSKRTPMKHVARKRFGQNFLHDKSSSTSITDAIDPAPGDADGRDRPRPGRDDEQLMLKRCRTCTWSSWTATWSRAWKRPSPAKLTIHSGDALKFDFGGDPGAGRGRSCASSATCRTTSPARCCSTWRRSRRRSKTSTSCCKRKWSSAWWPSRAARRTAGCR
jgi:hypothetical protein